MTLNRSRSSRIRAIGQRVGDPVGQELAVRKAGDRVVEGPTLDGLEEMGVVEGDRGELGKPAQGRDLADPERPLHAARCQPDHADDPAARRQGNADDGAEDARRHVAGPLRPGVVVIDGDRPPFPVDEPREPAVDRHAVAEEIGEQADPVADDE